MYSTCIHCNASLGANESIEAFPVGKRLAFDASAGRLWVVCRKCERWNLSPLEERWEAVEQGERAFRDTRVRVSTDNIGLARLRDGTELVRIGKPLRPEFAAWRYGDQFGRRRMRMAALGIGGTAAVGLGVAGMVAASASLVAFLPIFHLLNMGVVLSTSSLLHKPTALPEGGWILPAGAPKLIARGDVPEGWGIEIGYSVLDRETAMPTARDLFTRSLRRPMRYGNNNMEIGRLQLRGRDTTALLRRLLPRINRGGASRARLQESVAMIEQAGGSERFGEWAATQRRAWGARQAMGDTGDLQHIPAPARLAFEMAVHEDSERRAMHGELAALEAEWRAADEIARIADDLLPNPSVQQRLDRLRDRDED
jgi:hypothetical protein